jgi:hypothetical protein
MQPDPFRADVSAARSALGQLGDGLTVWSNRREPDAAARWEVSDTMAAADELLAATHRIRARLQAEIFRSDQEARDRVDAMLAARTLDGPPLPDPGDRHRKTLASPETGTSADGILRPGEDDGRATHEAAP